MNRGRRKMTASDMIHALEVQMTVYRPESELSQLNRRAVLEPASVEPSPPAARPARSAATITWSRFTAFLSLAKVPRPRMDSHC